MNNGLQISPENTQVIFSCIFAFLHLFNFKKVCPK